MFRLPQRLKRHPTKNPIDAEIQDAQSALRALGACRPEWMGGNDNRIDARFRQRSRRGKAAPDSIPCQPQPSNHH